MRTICNQIYYNFLFSSNPISRFAIDHWIRNGIVDNRIFKWQACVCVCVNLLTYSNSIRLSSYWITANSPVKIILFESPRFAALINININIYSLSADVNATLNVYIQNCISFHFILEYICLLIQQRKLQTSTQRKSPFYYEKFSII